MQELVVEGKPQPFCGDGTTRGEYTYITDIVQGVLASYDRCAGYEIYNLGESATTSLAELVETLGKHAGKAPILEFQPNQPGDVPITYVDVSKAKAKLGYVPTTPLADAVKKYVAWCRASGLIR